MKKVVFIIGIGVGFVLGSKVGTGPWDTLENRIRSLKARPEVEEAMNRVQGVASDQVAGVAQKVNEKLPPNSREVPV